MERKGGCCIAPRYGAAAGGQQAGAAWQMGRIMLKFRPIAPKPAAMAPVPTPAPVPAAAAGAGRGKRKAVGGGGGRRGRKPKRAATVAQVVAPAVSAPVAPAGLPVGECRKDKDCEKEKSLSSRSSSSSGMTSVDSLPHLPPPQQHHQPTTLPLMPVSPGGREGYRCCCDGGAVCGGPRPARSTPGASAGRFRTVPAATWVTVEELPRTCRDGEEAPSSAARIGPGPDGDAAPAFVSDQWGRVTWSNAAFARAVSADDEAGASAPAVALAGALPAWGTCAGFTCRVRVVRHAAPRRAGGSSVVAPCDVWLLDAAGCYLWRLDLQAALTLGGLPLSG
ncbi:hypothetical protein SETIT_3G087100v2 [Setaria italica]|uniref:DUF7950 domain-containing protein n=1 Tax=Setaria italica TaxID=4555 RepID=A0A368QEW1_SETIT|nr:atherin-like [Setaria italica]RCV15800.1 hypothetical protein SETIT_3G087100v2 [Setaria italica]